MSLNYRSRNVPCKKFEQERKSCEVDVDLTGKAHLSGAQIFACSLIVVCKMLHADSEGPFRAWRLAQLELDIENELAEARTRVVSVCGFCLVSRCRKEVLQCVRLCKPKCASKAPIQRPRNIMQSEFTCKRCRAYTSAAGLEAVGLCCGFF